MKAMVLPFGVAALVIVSSVFAQPAQVPASPGEALKQAAVLRDDGRLKDAIKTLKAGMREFPDHEHLRHALALAYLKDGNAFWALKVLREYEQEHPPACNSRAFQAWIHIKQANFELAQEILESPGCDTPDYARARNQLLRARLAAQRGDDAEAARLVEQARTAGRFYEEDKAWIDAMSFRYDPGRMPVTSWKIDLAAGWTSNGLAGSPQDPADVGSDTASPLTQLDARLRVVIPASHSLRPVIEAQLRELQIMADTVAFLSYRQPALRPGLLIGDVTPRLLLTYGFDAVQIAGSDRYDDGPLWYSEAHRFDYELEATDTLFAFGGGGRRWYREAGRTRWEAEQGLAFALPVTRSLRVMSGASARWHRASNEAYDAVGATLLTQVIYQLPAKLEARLNASYSHDDYPRSRGYFPGSAGGKRTDAQVRVKPGIWSPSWGGLRFGLDYEYSHRGSTAANYAYGDNRVLLHGVWTMDGDRFGVELIPAEGREAIPYDVAASGKLSGEELRIRDLMRQDEAVKRGSSCLN